MTLFLKGFGEELSPKIEHELRSAFPRIRIVHVHGTTRKPEVYVEVHKESSLNRGISALLEAEHIIARQGGFHRTVPHIVVSIALRRLMRRNTAVQAKRRHV